MSNNNHKIYIPNTSMKVKSLYGKESLKKQKPLETNITPEEFAHYQYLKILNGFHTIHEHSLQFLNGTRTAGEAQDILKELKSELDFMEQSLEHIIKFAQTQDQS